MRPRRRAGALAGIVTVVLAAGCGGGEAQDEADRTTAGDEAVEVRIDTFMFEPDPIEVEAGTTVTWTNEDDILHTVVAGPREAPTGDFEERLDGPGSTAEVTFEEPGTFDYVCDIHRGMDGQVVVRE